MWSIFHLNWVMVSSLGILCTNIFCVKTHFILILENSSTILYPIWAFIYQLLSANHYTESVSKRLFASISLILHQPKAFGSHTNLIVPWSIWKIFSEIKLWWKVLISHLQIMSCLGARLDSIWEIVQPFFIKVEQSPGFCWPSSIVSLKAWNQSFLEYLFSSTTDSKAIG